LPLSVSLKPKSKNQLSAPIIFRKFIVREATRRSGLTSKRPEKITQIEKLLLLMPVKRSSVSLLTSQVFV
jgi:hypothetical protein